MSPSLSATEPEVYRFERFRLDGRERLLFRGGEEISLPPKHFDLLLSLVRRGGRLATKDELLAEVWPAVVVTEASLSQAVSQLRRALGEPASVESFILTVPKVGYRFGVPVDRVTGSAPTPAPASRVVPRPGKAVWRQRLLVGLAAFGLFAAAFVAIGLRSQALRQGGGAESEVPRAGEPGDPGARRLYFEGLSALRIGDCLTARDRLEQALAREGGSPLALSALAEALGTLGDDRRAAELATRAARLSGGLAAEDRQWLEARAAAAEHDWPRAIERFEALFARYPDRVEIGLDLVSTLLRAGRGPTAVLAVGRLRQLRSPLVEDPRIDLAEAEVALAVSEYQRAAAAASRAREGADRLGSSALRVRALGVAAEALRHLDRLGEAREGLQLLRAEAESIGDERSLAQALLGLGAVAHREQDGPAARRLCEEALARFRHLGDRRGEIAALGSLAELLAGDQEADAARRSGEAAVALAREIGDVWSEGIQMARLVSVLHVLGDTSGAVALAEEALPRLRASGNQGRLLAVLSNLAISAIEAGELKKAEGCLDEAEGLARAVGNPGSRIHLSRTRAYLAQARGDLPTAARLYREALDLARAVRFASQEAELCHDLAFVEIELGRPAEAAELARTSERIHREVGDVESAIEAAAAGAWAKAAAGDLPAGRVEIARLRRELQDPALAGSRHGVVSAEAEIAELAGDWVAARRARLEVIAILEGWEAALVLIDERLGLARAEQHLGRRAEAAALAREVLAAAEEHGMESTARQARALVESLEPSR